MRAGRLVNRGSGAGYVAPLELVVVVGVTQPLRPGLSYATPPALVCDPVGGSELEWPSNMIEGLNLALP
jgi:hypothetical protein